MGKYDDLLSEEAPATTGKYSDLLDAAPSTDPNSPGYQIPEDTETGLPPPTSQETSNALAETQAFTPPFFGASDLQRFMHKPSPAWLQPFERGVRSVAEYQPLGQIPEGPDKPGYQQFAAGIYNPLSGFVNLKNAALVAGMAAQPEIGAGILAATMAPAVAPWWQQMKRLPQMTPAEGLKLGTETWSLLAAPFLHGAKPAFEPVPKVTGPRGPLDFGPDIPGTGTMPFGSPENPVILPQGPKPIEAEITAQGGETDAIQPSDAQVQGRETTLGQQARPDGTIPQPGDSDYVVGEAQGAEARGNVPGAEPEPTGEPVVAETPETNAPGIESPVVPPAEEAPVLEVAPEVAPAPARTFRVPADQFGNADVSPVASYVIENGGLVSKTAAKKSGRAEQTALWDDAPLLKHPTHNKIWRPDGEMPDVMATNLFDAGLIKEPTVQAMYGELEKESLTARRIGKEARGKAKQVAPQVKQAVDFGKAQATEQAAGTEPVHAADLDIGSTIKVGDEDFKVTAHNMDDMTVTLEDGSKFGIQEVGVNDIIYGEVKPEPPKVEPKPAPEELKLAPPETEAEKIAREGTEAAAKTARETEAEKKAQVKYGWQQKKAGTTGDLGQMELGGEVPGKAQPDLFAQGKKIKLRAKNEGGFVNPEVLKDAAAFGQRLYQKGMSYAQWAGKMLRHLGDGIRDHLKTIWDDLTSRRLPRAGERGAVGPGRAPGALTQESFRAAAKQGGHDPKDPKVFEHWKTHLESLPLPGETFAQHAARVPAVEVNKANYDFALSNGQILLAKQIKTAALKRGAIFEAPAARPSTRARPRVTESPPNEITVKDAATGKTSTFIVPPDRVPAQINYHLKKLDEIVSAPKDALKKAADLANLPTPGGPRPDDWHPDITDAPAEVDLETGGVTREPPPGSNNGEPPAGSNVDPAKYWAQNNRRSIKDWWESFWPRDRKMIEQDPETGAHMIIAHQNFIADSVDGFYENLNTRAHHNIRDLNHDPQLIADAEDVAVKHFDSLINDPENPMHPEVALDEAIRDSPLREVFEDMRDNEPIDDAAADMLGVPRPKKVTGPYLPRITSRGSELIIELGHKTKGIVSQMRKSIGIFDESRVHRTMMDGINREKGGPVVYKTPFEAWLQRKKVGALLRATANAVDYMRKNGGIFDTPEAARAASKDGKTAIKIEGLGGRDYWAKSRQQAIFIDHNFSNLGRGRHPIGRAVELLNSYIRNPNLVNPLPHITKNMLYKYLLRTVRGDRLAADWLEFRNNSNPELRAEFEKYIRTPKTFLRIPQLMARELPTGLTKLIGKRIALNEFSQKIIFQKADPAMRYSLWKHYLRQGMNPAEAAGHTWIDLVRYDANSGGMSLWKSIPLNFFTAWRTGTYVSIFKAMKEHPYRTLAFIGATEYMREAVFRKSLTWTHMPIDYVTAPIAEVIDGIDKANKAIKLGANPVKAYAGVALGAAQIIATTAAFGPGGAQGPDSIKKFIDIVFGGGSVIDKAKATNMFWGLAQLANMPQEFLAWRKDGDPKHIALIFSNLALGTHEAIKYEPRRLGSLIPESWPGMQKTPEFKEAQRLREKREQKTIKAGVTAEKRHGVTAGFYEAPGDIQWEQLRRGAGEKPGQLPKLPGLERLPPLEPTGK